MITVTRTIHIQRGRGNRHRLTEVPAAATVPEGRVPRISKLIALALHFDRLIREGVVSDQSELAALCHITQPRVTQLLNLTLLAPDIIEELLHLPRATIGRDRINERMMRVVSAACSFEQQRKIWLSIR